MKFNILITLLFYIWESVSGHGFLADPPQRGKADNGAMVGVCGNAGYMRAGSITRTYKTGQVLTIHSSLTANHLGTIIVGLCSTPDNPSQACFDSNRLKVVSSSKDNDYTARIPGYSDPRTHLYNHFYHDVQLPSGFRCEHCVLQWYWWGRNTGELYKNCADIRIADNAAVVPTYDGSNVLKTTTTQRTTTRLLTTTTTTTTRRTTRPNSSNITTTTSTTTTTLPDEYYYDEEGYEEEQEEEIESVFVLCSKSKPPPKSTKTVIDKNNGTAVICFWKSDAQLDCDLCKANCISDQTECPQECDCRWYA